MMDPSKIEAEKQRLQARAQYAIELSVDEAGLDPEFAADAIFALGMAHMLHHLGQRAMSRLLYGIAVQLCAVADSNEETAH